MMREFKTGTYANKNENNNSSKQLETTSASLRQQHNGGSSDGISNNVSDSLGSIDSAAANASAIACDRLSPPSCGLVGDSELSSLGAGCPNNHINSSSPPQPTAGNENHSMDINNDPPNSSCSTKQRRKSSNKAKLVSQHVYMK